MEITPNELRDIEISRAVRGYDTHEVHELLDRAADTIEALHARVSELGLAMAAPVAAAPAPEATTDAAARTLALAQRVADETVDEAKTQAAAIVAEAETTRASLISDAEAEVQRIQQTERARVEAEIAQLDARRVELDASVDDLERFESEYRERLTAIVRDDLDRLAERGSLQPGDRPNRQPQPDATAGDSADAAMTHEAAGEAALDAANDADATGLLPALDTVSVDASASGRSEASDIEPPAASPTEASSEPDHEAASAATGTAAAVESVTAPVIGAAPLIGSALDPDPVPTIDLAHEQAAERAALGGAPEGQLARAEADDVDDDDFFASLRDATSEHAAIDASESRLFESDDDRDSSFRDVFKRRR